MIVTAGIIAALALVLFGSAAFWINWWWFGSMGYRGVLTARYSAQVVTFLIGGAVAAAVFGVNAWYALRRSEARPAAGRVAAAARRLLLAGLALLTAIVGVSFGLSVSGRWETWLLWLNGDAFGIEDPVFGRDVGFFIFALPALHALVGTVLTLGVVSWLAAAMIYIVRLGVNVRDVRRYPRQMRVHLLALAGAVLVIVAARTFLANYDLVYSERGAAFGAGYTDVNIQRLANWAIALFTLVIAALLLVNAFVQRVRLLLGAVIGWGVVSVVLGYAVPAFVQQTVVEPSELRRERPYIANNLAMTRAGFALDVVTERELSGQAQLRAVDLALYPQTLDNIRLWDYRIIRTTYQQLQSFVPYYVFNDVDVDRYLVDGGIDQVVISARELDREGLPPTARTWTNRRLIYTHGYGAVVSPVGEVTGQGLPAFLVQRIPPNGTGVYEIARPEIYFGEVDQDWVAVGADQAEFSGNIETDNPGSGDYRYEGAARGSIGLGNYLGRLLLAAHLGDRNILLSGALTGDSRVLLHRAIAERAGKIAPFLRLDDDPLLVIADGRLVWIIDAYTVSGRFPHASRTRGINYIRHSVKVVVDAYDGTTTFYRTAEPDPIADAYGEIYDDLFTPIAAAPPALAAHFRYPEELFDIQSDVYATVHVTDPTAFYNGEDRWAVPLEQSGGSRARMEPYYVTMTLPGERAAQFALIRPFIPGGSTDRQNMTAWMAGRLDPSGRLALINYRFPRQETVFGPAQIEARIDQEPDISAQISLWNQSGSTVLRGNLLVIPIGESVLYVQPLYLQATNTQGALPELKRVIVASSERVVMRERLDDALAALTAGDGSAVDPAEVEGALPGGETIPSNVAGLVEQALDAFTAGETALAAGDWTAYGDAQRRLKEILDQLASVSTSTEATPSAAATPAANP